MARIKVKSIIKRILVFIRDVYIYIFQVIDAFILLPLKLLIGIVFIFLIILEFSYLFIFPAIFGRDNRSEQVLERVTGNLLGFEDSYTESDKRDRDLLKKDKLPENPNNIGDLVSIPYKKWKKIECYDDWRDERKEYYNIEAIEFITTRKSKRDKIRCIKPIPEYEIKSDKIPYKCGHFSCSGLRIYMNKYVAEYPEVLSNLMKIAEKPCEYVKGSPEASKNQLLENLRYHLYCDRGRDLFYQTPIKYTDIRIVNEKGVVEYNIIVDRKDNIKVRYFCTFWTCLMVSDLWRRVRIMLM